MNNLFTIISQFATTGNIREILPMGSGHIHETFRAFTEAAEHDDYVLQLVNTHVFRDPDAVMQNLDRVTTHIRGKLQRSGIPDIHRRVLTPVKLRESGFLYRDNEDRYWRCFVYIPDHRSYDRATSQEMVYAGGKAYGTFMEQLSDLDARGIRETIPGFHNLDLRISQFEEACHHGVHERLEETSAEIEMLRSRKDEMRTIFELGKAGAIPLRIVHHDTKINNVLFSHNGEGLCVIDLDTVMPGFVHDDFGDSIRTFTNTGEEDDVDLHRVSMNIDYFEAYTRGFLEVTTGMLTRVEKEHLALSSRVMTYMQVLRFLTDYLSGDPYYRIHHPKHNLQRTKAQLKLMLSMEEQFAEMQKIVRRWQ